MLARIQSLEVELARATALAEQVSELKNENQTLRAELAKYKAHYDMWPPPTDESPGSDHALAFQIREPGAQWRDERLSQPAIYIGTQSSSHINLNDSSVSQMHAVIEVTENSVSISDLGSSSGTYVNGTKVKQVKVELSNGDRIRVGNTEIIIGMHQR